MGATMTIMVGIDVGTTGIKALAVRPDGTVAAESFSGYAISSPRPKWAEQNPDEWWDAFCLATRELLKGGIDAEEVDAVGKRKGKPTLFVNSRARSNR